MTKQPWNGVKGASSPDKVSESPIHEYDITSTHNVIYWQNLERATRLA